MTDPITLYWQPGCTSCLRAKEFLRENGIRFQSVNVAEDSSGFERLTAYGVQAVPVITQGDRFIFAQVLSEIAKFLNIEDNSTTPLSVSELILKLQFVLVAARRYIHQIPVTCLNHTLPGRARTYRELGYHIFRVAECFVKATEGDTLTDEDLNASPNSNIENGADIATYGSGVLKKINSWREDAPENTGSKLMTTYFGEQTLHVVLERTAWHSAQHTRQLLMVLEILGIEPDGPLCAQDLAGLPMPKGVWDH